MPRPELSVSIDAKLERGKTVEVVRAVAGIGGAIDMTLAATWTDAVVALRLLVAGLVSERLVDVNTESIRRGAAIMVDGFNEQWRLVAAQSYEAGQSIGAAAIKFAWLTAPAPLGSAFYTRHQLTRQ